jgi:hypothetical protein
MQAIRAVYKNMRANPIIVREMHLRRGIKIRWWVFPIVCIVSLVGSLFYKQSTVVNLLVFVGVLALIANPIHATWLAANATSLVIKSEVYQFLYITAISNRKLIDGYVFSVFYQAKDLLLLTAALIPAVLVRLTDTVYNNYDLCGRTQAQCTPSVTSIVFHWVLLYSAWIVAAIGLLVLGVALSISLTLLLRNASVAGCGTLLFIVGLTIVFFLFQNVSWPDKDPIAALYLVVPFTIFLYIAAFAVINISQRVARPRP